MPNEFSDETTNLIANFLNEIGLEVIAKQIDIETFLPGILIDRGRIFVDESKLKYPGDLLHEAGHLAFASPELRSALSGEVVFPGVSMEPIEVQAIAWSFAAALYLGIDPKIVFHDGGYRGASQGLLFSLSCGVYFGLTGLREAGMTVFGDEAVNSGMQPYPHMIKWLCD
ncbi:MAG: hypothetical protein ABI999_18140 [Acidobacteriota bacterium]